MLICRYAGSLAIQCADGCVVYLNAVEIGRINMPAAPSVVISTTNALTTISTVPSATVISIPDASIQTGVHVVAVEVRELVARLQQPVFSGA